MVSRSWILIATAALLAFPAAPFAPAGAQDPSSPVDQEIAEPDPYGDVAIVASALPTGVGPYTDGLDLQEVKLFGETGEALRLSAKIADISAEWLVKNQVSAGLNFWFCFEWQSTPFAAKLSYWWRDPDPFPTLAVFGATQGPCTEQGATFAGAPENVFAYHIDPEYNSVELTVEKAALGRLTQRAPPAAGDQISNFLVVARDGRGFRYDLAPSAGPSSKILVLQSGTANQGDFRLHLGANTSPAIPCAKNRFIPAHVVEAGGTRGVPIVLQNLAPGDKQVRLEARVVTGDVGWTAGVLPNLPLGAAEPGGHRNVTLTALVGMPENAAHKDCATIQVRAFEEGSSFDFAESNFNVIAAESPTREKRLFHFHLDDYAAFCANRNLMWWNLQADEEGTVDDKEMYFRNCARDTSGASPFSDQRTSLITFLDVEPPRDLVINTSATGGAAKITLMLKSDGPPVKIRLSASVITGPYGAIDPIGEGQLKATVDGTYRPFEILVPVSFTRDLVAEGDPTRVVEAATPVGLFLAYAPDQQPLPSKVYLRAEGSTMELPIWDAVERRQIGLGVNGGFVSLSTEAAAIEYVNPGKPRGLNFTALNEGLATDTVEVSGALEGALAGWQVHVLPANSFGLDPGQAATFTLAVTPPEDAPEGAAVQVHVAATSRSDPTATSRLVFEARVTKGIDVGGGLDVDDEDGDGGGGGLPGFDAALVAAALAAVGGALRRRR